MSHIWHTAPGSLHAVTLLSVEDSLNFNDIWRNHSKILCQMQMAAPAAAEEPPQPLLQRSGKKEARLRALHFKGGKFEAPRPDEEDLLRSDLLPLASPALG